MERRRKKAGRKTLSVYLRTNREDSHLKKNLYIGEGNVLDLVVLHVESSFVIVMKCIR